MNKCSSIIPDCIPFSFFMSSIKPLSVIFLRFPVLQFSPHFCSFYPPSRSQSLYLLFQSNTWPFTVPLIIHLLFTASLNMFSFHHFMSYQGFSHFALFVFLTVLTACPHTHLGCRLKLCVYETANEVINDLFVCLCDYTHSPRPN